MFIRDRRHGSVYDKRTAGSSPFHVKMVLGERRAIMDTLKDYLLWHRNIPLAEDTFSDTDHFMLAADTERSGRLVLRNYEDHFDEKHACQFGAVEIVLNERCPYLSFRGTDTSIAE